MNSTSVTGLSPGDVPPTFPQDPFPMSDEPQTDDESLLRECEIQTFRSGGKGGQHHNTTDSGVRIIHKPTGIVATARERRSQLQNRKLALARLKARLKKHFDEPAARVSTRVPRREQAKRLDEKRQRGKTKKLRKPPTDE